MEIFEKVNLKAALEKLEKSSGNQGAEKTLSAFKNLFKAEWECDNRIQLTLSTSSETVVLDTPLSLDPQKIYRIEAIKSLCLNYRLRFLPSRYFKADFPIDTLRAIKMLERELETQIKSFYLLAPSKLWWIQAISATLPSRLMAAAKTSFGVLN